jgi:hypothetical protein
MVLFSKISHGHPKLFEKLNNHPKMFNKIINYNNHNHVLTKAGPFIANKNDLEKHSHKHHERHIHYH